MVKRIKFSLSHDPDFKLIGISTSIRGFKMAFLLNHHLNTDFKRIADFSWQADKSEEVQNYFIFRDQNQEEENSVFLVQNRHINGYLLPIFKQADCFFITHNQVDALKESDYIKNLKKIPNVLAAFKLEISSGKTLSRFFQELEIHLMTKKNPSKH